MKPKRKGRRMVAWTLWVFAGGLFAAPQLADYADQAVEAGVTWLATSAPGFVRPYLPKPVESFVPVAPVPHSRRQALATVTPSPIAAPVPTEAKPQPQRRLGAVAQLVDIAPLVAPSPKAVVAERPVRAARPHAGRGRHGKASATMAEAEDPAPVASKPAEPKRSASVDPFEGGAEGAGEPSTTRVSKPVAEPAGQQAKSGDSLDDLMAGGPGGDKARGRRSTSSEIDAMLKGVQKSDAQPTPKRTESANANPPLTAADIARAMSAVKSSAAECGKRFGDSGVADLKLTVSRDGTVSNVAVRGKLADTQVGRCVSQAVRAAVFPRNSGLTFDYRLDVR